MPEGYNDPVARITNPLDNMIHERNSIERQRKKRSLSFSSTKLEEDLDWQELLRNNEHNPQGSKVEENHKHTNSKNKSIESHEDIHSSKGDAEIKLVSGDEVEENHKKVKSKNKNYELFEETKSPKDDEICENEKKIVDGDEVGEEKSLVQEGMSELQNVNLSNPKDFELEMDTTEKDPKPLLNSAQEMSRKPYESDIELMDHSSNNSSILPKQDLISFEEINISSLDQSQQSLPIEAKEELLNLNEIEIDTIGQPSSTIQNHEHFQKLDTKVIIIDQSSQFPIIKLKHESLEPLPNGMDTIDESSQTFGKLKQNSSRNVELKKICISQSSQVSSIMIEKAYLNAFDATKVPREQSSESLYTTQKQVPFEPLQYQANIIDDVPQDMFITQHESIKELSKLNMDCIEEISQPTFATQKQAPFSQPRAVEVPVKNSLEDFNTLKEIESHCYLNQSKEESKHLLRAYYFDWHQPLKEKKKLLDVEVSNIHQFNPYKNHTSAMDNDFYCLPKNQNNFVAPEIELHHPEAIKAPHFNATKIDQCQGREEKHEYSLSKDDLYHFIRQNLCNHTFQSSKENPIDGVTSKEHETKIDQYRSKSHNNATTSELDWNNTKNPLQSIALHEHMQPIPPQKNKYDPSLLEKLNNVKTSFQTLPLSTSTTKFSRINIKDNNSPTSAVINYGEPTKKYFNSPKNKIILNPQEYFPKPNFDYDFVKWKNLEASRNISSPLTTKQAWTQVSTCLKPHPNMQHLMCTQSKPQQNIISLQNTNDMHEKRLHELKKESQHIPYHCLKYSHFNSKCRKICKKCSDPHNATIISHIKYANQRPSKKSQLHQCFHKCKHHQFKHSKHYHNPVYTDEKRLIKTILDEKGKVVSSFTNFSNSKDEVLSKIHG